MSDDYHPREHDHLVEPMFGGLGLEGRAAGETPARGPRGWLGRLWRALLRCVRPSRPASGR